jgi:hypothetical protein
MSDDEDDDDPLHRWFDANGVIGVRYSRLDDGKMMTVYVRADGSEVIPAESYGYDAKLTPYTKTDGRS